MNMLSIARSLVAIATVAATVCTCGSTAHAVPFRITQLTDNSGDDRSPPHISGDNVVWSGPDGRDYEIFLATPLVSPVPEPSTYAMAAIGLLG